jgi:cytochrome oxidase assembly protein ShyY1
MNEPKYKIGEKFQPAGMPELEVLRYEKFNGNLHYGVRWYNEHKLEYGWVMVKLMDMVR